MYVPPRLHSHFHSSKYLTTNPRLHFVPRFYSTKCVIQHKFGIYIYIHIVSVKNFDRYTNVLKCEDFISPRSHLPIPPKYFPSQNIFIYAYVYTFIISHTHYTRMKFPFPYNIIIQSNSFKTKVSLFSSVFSVYISILYIISVCTCSNIMPEIFVGGMSNHPTPLFYKALSTTACRIYRK